MIPYEIISKKRDGKKLTREEIHFFINEYLKGNIEDYQTSALLMAIFLNGMDDEETYTLTEAYIESGKIIDLSDIPGPKVDKHSTGGVGDKVSLILAPIAASLGVVVPMISGIGLGHTGGTLDKLQSLPGFQIYGSLAKFKMQLMDIGLAIYGQSDDFVPADRNIYAIRNLTATIDSLPLIVASIMSKKITEGIDSLVLDVKYGNGSFTPEIAQAKQLAQKLIIVGKSFRKKVIAYLTAMDQPLGYNIGNWLEVKECIECLQGNGPEDLMEVVTHLVSEMLILAGKAKTLDTATQLCKNVISNGNALTKLSELVEYQGGEAKYINQPESYPVAKYCRPVYAWQNGYIAEIQTRELGMASVRLGAGRLRAEDKIDPQAGIVLFKKIGDYVKSGETILELYTNREKSLDLVVYTVEKAFKLSDSIPVTAELIKERISY